MPEPWEAIQNVVDVSNDTDEEDWHAQAQAALDQVRTEHAEMAKVVEGVAQQDHYPMCPLARQEETHKTRADDCRCLVGPARTIAARIRGEG